MGINIPDPAITPAALAIILNRMLQLSGTPLRKETFNIPTLSLQLHMSVYQAWLALSLPAQGAAGVRACIINLLIYGRPLTLFEIKSLWSTFQDDAEVSRHMWLNYMRAFARGAYTYEEQRVIRYWILSDRARNAGVEGLEAVCPGYRARIRGMFNGDGVVKERGGKEREEEEGVVGRKLEILEKSGTKRVSAAERKKRERDDAEAMRRRLGRVRSDESIRSVETVVWDPPVVTPVSGKKVRMKLSGGPVGAVEELGASDRGTDDGMETGERESGLFDLNELAKMLGLVLK